MHTGWAVVVRGDRIEAAGPTASMTVPPARAPSRLQGHDVDARHDRRPFASVAASLQRDHLERSGAARSRWRCAWRAPSITRAPLDGRHHDRARSRHRRRGVCRRRIAPGDQRGHRSRPAHAGGRSGDGGHRQLCAEGIRARGDRAARRRRSRRPRRRGARRARTDRARRGLHQDLRGLSLGTERRDAARALRSRKSSESSRRPTAAAVPWSRMPRRPRACAARSWAASRPSSTATRARRRSGS